MEEVALDVASRHLSVPSSELKIVRIEPVEWRDSSLGCPQPGMEYLQVITPGRGAYGLGARTILPFDVATCIPASAAKRNAMSSTPSARAWSMAAIASELAQPRGTVVVRLPFQQIL
jgi:hypothetical protein